MAPFTPISQSGQISFRVFPEDTVLSLTLLLYYTYWLHHNMSPDWWACNNKSSVPIMPCPFRKWVAHVGGSCWLVRAMRRQSSAKKCLKSWSRMPSKKRLSGKMWLPLVLQSVRKSSTMWCSVVGRGRIWCLRRFFISEAAWMERE